MRFLLFLLFPFSIIFWIIVQIRNIAFRWGVLKRYGYNTPIICVGNIFLGGTGKTPMVEYLVRHYMEQGKKVAILSRGYGRKTRGFIEVKKQDIAQDVGDELIQYKRKFENVSVFVCEKRKIALDRIDGQFDIIIMDDGFQHRSIITNYNYVLFDFKRVINSQFLLPCGILREPTSMLKEASEVIISKYPHENLNPDDEKLIRRKLKLPVHRKLHFSNINYDFLVCTNDFHNESFDFLAHKRIMILTAIANPDSLYSFVSKHNQSFIKKNFRDHHFFTDSDIEDIQKKCEREKIELILTTEKDYYRSDNLGNLKLSIYMLSISTQFFQRQSLLLPVV